MPSAAPFAVTVYVASVITPFVAFWPYSRLAPRMRPLALLSMLWQGADLIWFGVGLTQFGVLGMPNLYARFGVPVLEARAIITECVLAALLGLLFREQRQVTLERAMLK